MMACLWSSEIWRRTKNQRQASFNFFFWTNWNSFILKKQFQQGLLHVLKWAYKQELNLMQSFEIKNFQAVITGLKANEINSNNVVF